eukprot:900213-Alexandrium_andersonii.AAC.1
MPRIFRAVPVVPSGGPLERIRPQWKPNGFARNAHSFRARIPGNPVDTRAARLIINAIPS